MSEAKYTPGPWVMEYDNCDAGTCQWYLVGPAVVEASYNLTELQDEQWKANARLISAAPDQHGALQATQLLLERLGLESSDEYQRNAAAIAKATGQT